MKKIIYSLILAILFLANGRAMAQVSSQSFVPSAKKAELIFEQNNIKASSVEGKLGSSDAVFINFQNTGDKAVTFSWSAKDKNGKVIASGNKLVLKGGESTLTSDNAATKNTTTFILPVGISAKDISIQINFN